MGGRLPTDAELTKIAQEVYNDKSITTSYKHGLTIDTSKIPTPLYGLGSSWDFCWSSKEESADKAGIRDFNSSYTCSNYGYIRYSSYTQAVCVTD